MKNSYRQSEGRSVRRLAAVTIFVLLVFAVDLLGGGRLREVVRSGSAKVFQVGAGAAATASGSEIFSTRRALIRENEALKKEIAALQVRAAESAVLAGELESLRGIVHLAEDLPGTTVPVASSFLASPYGTFLIGAGSEQGIHVGDLVIVGSGESGYVLGYVSEPGARVSLATRIFAPGAELPGIVGEAEITLEGRGGNGYVQVPASLPIAEGDPVISPRFGNRPVGVVGGIVEESGSASKEVFVRFPVNLSTVQFVYVVPQN